MHLSAKVGAIPCLIFAYILNGWIVYNQGVFTGVMYGLRRMKDIFLPFIKSEYVKYPDYKHKKEAKKIKNYSFLFFTGLLLTIPAIYFMVRFYQIP